MKLWLDVPKWRAPAPGQRGAQSSDGLLSEDDDAVLAIFQPDQAKERGLTSPYLKPFVVARVNFTRFSKATSFDFDEALDKIIASASKFNVDRVKQEDVAKVGGQPSDE